MSRVLSLDLETLSLDPRAAILQIGAVLFDKSKTETYRQMYENPTFCVTVDWQGQEAIGRHICPLTTEWWNQQDDHLRHRLFDNPDMNFHEAINLFNAWLIAIVEKEGVDECWVKGNRDGIWIETAFETCGLKFPIKYRGVKCVRTAGTTVGASAPDVQNAQPHHALSDALVQAMWVQQITQRIDGWREAIKERHFPCAA